MQAKKIGYFLSTFLLLSGLIYSVGALTTTVSFHGGGVTIDLSFPEEAHPTESITHNITITANTALTLYNFTVVIKAPPNTTWQTKLEENNQDLPENMNLSRQMRFTLPQDANGPLYCLIYVQSNQTADYLSYTFYTTLVSYPTFSEIQSMYDALWDSYNSLNATYTALNETFTNLSAQYETLLEQNKDLIADYDSLEATYESLLAQHTKLSDDYDTLNANYRSKITELGALQSDYDDLNSTRYSLQADYDALQAVYDELNQTYTELEAELNDLQQRITFSENALNTDRIVMFIFVVTVACLIALIIYIKKKKPEPYVVIRKETVAMKPDEKS